MPSVLATAKQRLDEMVKACYEANPTFVTSQIAEVVGGTWYEVNSSLKRLGIYIPRHRPKRVPLG
jgi:hypothetical protein